MTTDRIDKSTLYPALAGFFIMGFCDIVAPITGKIAEQYADHATLVGFLPSMVFLWLFLISTPLASLANRYGRKSVALAGYAFTVAGLAIPLIAGRGCGLEYYFAAFALLGIGNTAVQVAVNPMLAMIVPASRMTSFLTVGQICRNISIMLVGPLVLLLGADWPLLFAIYAALTVIGGIAMWRSPLDDRAGAGVRSVTMGDCFRLLGNRTVAMCAIGIGAIIACDVAVGTLSSILIDSDSSILTSTGFYACRIVGTVVGALVLARYSEIIYLRWNMTAALALAAALLLFREQWVVYAATGLLGFTFSCVFASLYAVATKAVEASRANAVSGLLIMFISAGAISSPIVGAIIRAAGGETIYGVLFLIPCLTYIIWSTFKLRRYA